MELRKKALETTDKNGTSEQDPNKDEKKIKKKKNKRDGRKDKKKRKGGKKRKRGASSSTSSSDSDDSGSSSGSEESAKKGENPKDDSKNSFRVKMRNMSSLKSENDEKTGKWTMVSANANKPVAPPAPLISKEGHQEKKKDDQVIGLWSGVEPIISQEEKQLLANLKGRLKSSQAKVEKDPPPSRRNETREKSRDRSRERSRGYRGRRSRSRSRSRGRYSRRYSRSRSRSGSRGRRRVERPIVKFPTEPRPPPSREEKKLPARSYVTTKKEDSTSNTKKVMPMIGKMPVYKKQLNEKKFEEPIEEKVEQMQVEAVVEEKKSRDDTWDDFMPDPLQYSALMGAPPPPPAMVEEPEVVPPGLDPEQDSEFIPKPISDVPIARKGPLPKDFQDTLDLLYDTSGTPKPVVIEPKIVEAPIIEPPIPVDSDGPQMIMPEELSQHHDVAMMYGYYGQGIDEAAAELASADTAPPEEAVPEQVKENNEKHDGSVEMNEADEASKDQQMEMDDLAMLGIDINDVGSGMW